jgi:hypothetical protein
MIMLHFHHRSQPQRGQFHQKMLDESKAKRHEMQQVEGKVEWLSDNSSGV